MMLGNEDHPIDCECSFCAPDLPHNVFGKIPLMLGATVRCRIAPADFLNWSDVVGASITLKGPDGTVFATDAIVEDSHIVMCDVPYGVFSRLGMWEVHPTVWTNEASYIGPPGYIKVHTSLGIDIAGMDHPYGLKELSEMSKSWVPDDE